MSKRISEIVISKDFRRIKKDSDGNRYYEYVTFDMKYNPTIRNFSIRLFSKFIDLILYGIVGVIIYKVINRKFDDFNEILAVSFILLLILNPLLESLFGKTLGKKMFNIQIIDDYGNKPDLLLSYKRNFLSCVNVIQLFRPVPGELGIRNNKHNEICKTYTILDKDKAEIISKLTEDF